MIKHPKTFTELVPLHSEDGTPKGFTYRGSEFVHHSALHHFETAFFNLVFRQKVFIAAVAFTIGIVFILNWHLTIILLFALLTAMYFIDLLFNAYLIFRSSTGVPEFTISEDQVSVLRDEDCPTYTIFCPLYKEWQVVPQFAEAMQKLNYPHEKLQILFLLEENDKETVEKISQAPLPPHFQIVVVPDSKPKTKPKAMNYGLKYATGQYIVIYDAEDVPDADQLKKAVIAFQHADSNVACVQAKLNFYNPRQNLLTILFTAEYSLWFDLILPGFQSIQAPIPLGGTSNHFRADILRQLQGWDAFNVTEDCDLGMRLSKKGYKTAIIDSTTLEEANSQTMNWYNQRSRWIKGYIQTYLVHTRNPKTYFEHGKGRDFFLFQLIVGGKILSLFINPFLWLTTILYFALRAKIGPLIDSFFPWPILYLGVFSLVLGNFLYLYYYMIGCAKRGHDGLIKYVFFVPLYWLGMSVAAWKAMYEIVVKPHYWAKTVHGLHLAQAPIQAAIPAGLFSMQSVLDRQPPQIALHNMPISPVPGGKKVVIMAERISTLASRDSYASTFKKFVFSGAGLLIASTIISNFLNYAFSAYIGREVSLDDFGTITILNTLIYVISVFLNALTTTVTHKVSYLEGEAAGLGTRFFNKMWFRIGLPGVVLSVAWILATPFIAHYLHVSDYIVLASFAPAILFGVFNSSNTGYLQGIFSFGSVALITLLTPLAKLLIAIFGVESGFRGLIGLAVPCSIIASWALSEGLVRYLPGRMLKAKGTPHTQQEAFPLNFYFAACMRGISVAAFLSIDVLLAKHYLSAYDAGLYSMLSLVGKMIFFFGTLFTVFIVAVVSRSLGERRSTEQQFSILLLVTMLLTGISGLLLMAFGPWLVPLLLGPQAVLILPLLVPYAIAMMLFSISTTIVLYRLSRSEYFFPIISLAISFLFVRDLVFFHADVAQFVRVVTLVNVYYFLCITVAHLLYPQIKYVYRNVRDFFLVLRPLPAAPPLAKGRKRVLIFNWRDSESAFAGGAEIYIHNLAELWAKEGHSVTLFTSNDGTQRLNGTIGGIRVIRRGGFFAVYPLALLYYVCIFRGAVDVIVDCENGIPFFSALVAREPVFCLVHHIHQEVFRKSLPGPMAAFAAFLERVMMPLVYRKSTFVTISDSSKREMEKMKITSKPIEVIHPGVDLSFLAPGVKSRTPLIAYIGRLKDYKSVDVLIHAFSKVVRELPNAKLVIAGDGDDAPRLDKLVEVLKLSQSVTFLGKVTEEKKREIMQEAWVCVNPSMMEGWGITTIEANACGTTVIASDVPGLRDSVRHFETGLLVPYGDVDAFHTALISVLTKEESRQTMEENALLWAKNFAWERSSEKFMGIISDVWGVTRAQARVTQHI